MDTLTVILISLLILCLGFYLVGIEDYVRVIKYEQHEIYLLLERYLLKREVEREKQENEGMENENSN